MTARKRSSCESDASESTVVRLPARGDLTGSPAGLRSHESCESRVATATRCAGESSSPPLVELPPLVRRHCVQLFPDRAPPDERTLIIVTVQRTQHDIIQMGADVDREKDVCLERFYAWGNDVMARLRADAAVAAASPPWADLIDPCSGIGLGRIVAIAWRPCGSFPC
jgi:hypothetical protein